MDNLTQQTLEAYDQSAAARARRYDEVDMRGTHRIFLDQLEEGATILDLGCGSGRDTLAFREKGHPTMALDGSPRMVEEATKRLGSGVVLKRFDELDYSEEFDGVWACASLIHVQRSELQAVLQRVIRALKPHGVLYASFKQGESRTLEDGILTEYYRAHEIRALGKDLGLIETHWWETADTLQERHGPTPRWMNFIWRKP